LVKSLEAAVKRAERKGATDCKVELSNWDGVKVIGYREETDAEFQKRVRKARVARAIIVLAREENKEQEKKAQEVSRQRNKLRKESAFKDAVKSLSQKDIERLMKEAEAEKKGQKEKSPKKTVKKATRRSTILD
jgi:hypothetical protein